MASGRRDIAQVCHEILVTPLAMVLRIGEVQLHRAPRHQIANIMQLTMVDVLSSGGVPARRTGTVARIAVFFDALGLRQVFDPQIRRVRFVLARTQFTLRLGDSSWRFHPASLLQKS